jgi:hypothetical protein
MLSSGFANPDSPLSKLSELSTLSRSGNTMSLKIRCPAGEAAGLISTALQGQ